MPDPDDDGREGPEVVTPAEAGRLCRRAPVGSLGVSLDGPRAAERPVQSEPIETPLEPPEAGPAGGSAPRRSPSPPLSPQEGGLPSREHLGADSPWGVLVGRPLSLRSGRALVTVLVGYRLLTFYPSVAAGAALVPRRLEEAPLGRPEVPAAPRPGVPSGPGPQPQSPERRFAASALGSPGQRPEPADGLHAREQPEGTTPASEAGSGMAESVNVAPSARKFRLPRSVGELSGAVPPPPRVE